MDTMLEVAKREVMLDINEAAPWEYVARTGHQAWACDELYKEGKVHRIGFGGVAVYTLVNPDTLEKDL